MFCPRCGQQQISDEMRFCSRCGLLISGLAEWLVSGGAPIARAAGTEVSLASPRRKGIRRGLKLMFLSGVLFFVFLAISLIVDEGALLIVPFLIFFASLVIMLYARLFSSASPPMKSQQAQASGLGGMPDRSALPPANIPTYGPGTPGGQQVRTNELAHPPSVTEHTTKLFDPE